MGYSTSLKTLEKILPDLQVLASGRPCHWHTRPGEESKFQYKIREALYIARLHHQRYPALARAATSFEIRVLGPGSVAALPSGVPFDTFDLPEPQPATSQELPPLVAANATQPQVAVPTLVPVERHAPPVAGPQSVYTVITAWNQARLDGHTKLYFPEASLDHASLTKLYRYAKAQAPTLAILFAAPALTLCLENDDVREVQWTPDDGA